MITKLLALAATLCSSAFGFTGAGNLTFVSDPTFNKLQVTITASGATSTKTTTVTGVLNTQINANPASGASTAFTISGGNLAMTNMSFVLKLLFITIANINTTNMAGTVYTTVPPGAATATVNGGTFDAALHRFLINQGTITGTALGTPISLDFSSSPLVGQGMGTGSITLVPGASSATHRTCLATMILPIDFTDSQVLSGVPVSLRVKGSIKAVGNALIPLNGWIEWLDQNNLAGVGFNNTIAAGSTPLGLAWATGLNPTSPSSSITPLINSSGAIPAANFNLPDSGSRAYLLLEKSTTSLNGEWSTVDPADVSLGLNPIPPGHSGPVSVLLRSTTGRCFLRVVANQP